MTEIRIAERLVGDGHPVFIIAEAGVNHDGELERAKDLIDIAAMSGADAVKFQTFRADLLTTPETPLASYQRGNGMDVDQRSMLQHLELPDSAWPTLADHARSKGLLFLSTPFDEESLDMLVRVGIPAIKIASPDLTNHRLLRHAAKFGMPLIVSTGMATSDEIAAAVKTVTSEGGDLALLHCMSSYPAPAEQLNLRAIRTIAERFDKVAGYSDHALGILAPIAAVAVGARIVEKHFTTDPARTGPDHRASLGPAELRQMVDGIRAVERMLGDGEKRPRPAEEELRRLSRRSLTYREDLPAGTVIRSHHIALKRPGSGLAPDREQDVVGRRLNRDVRGDTLVTLTDFE